MKSRLLNVTRKVTSASNSGICAVLTYVSYVKAYVDVFIGRWSMNLDDAPDNPVDWDNTRQRRRDRVAVAIAEGYEGSRHGREHEKPS